MHGRRLRAFLRWATLALVFLLPLEGLAQVFVYPRRPNKSQVRYYEFDWQHVDILVGPDADRSRADDMNRQISRGDPGTPRPGDETAESPHVPVPGEPPSDSDSPAPVNPPPTAPLGTAPGTGDVKPDDEVPPGTDVSTTPGPSTGSADGGTEADEGDAPFVQRRLDPARSPKELLGAKSGGVRLFFYEREREIAERAAALIVDAYVYLVGQFDYVPTQTFPYILYSSYQEFLQTNLFPLQEGTLGVTSPVDLKLTLPYFGDHQLFAHVSAHEMAHQFTIQKVRTAVEKAEIWGEPLGAMPLWFIEGIAEYYAHQGIDPEAEMLVRDLVVNPDFEQGFVLLDFFEDRPWSFLWTYKMGQVRAAFLEETYGKGTLQKVLEESPRLAGTVKGQPALPDFKALMARITGQSARQVSARFEAWLKARAYKAWLATDKTAAALEPLEGFGFEYVDSLRASPNGNLLMVRSIDPTTGRSRLSLLDHRVPARDRFVAIDGVPGVESLHPVWGRNFDLTDSQIVFVAESKGVDVLYVQDIQHEANRTAAPPPAVGESPADRALPPGHPPLGPTSPVSPTPGAPSDAATATRGEPTTADGRTISEAEAELWNVRLKLGKRRRFELGKKGLVAAYAPAFSPDGKRVAFVGFNQQGLRDVYVLDPDEADEHGFRLTQVTKDEFSERHLAWGPDGIVYSSDATAHGRYNLFRVKPETPDAVERLTTEARDHHSPTITADGRVLFTAYDRGRADVHEYSAGSIIRRTDISTGLFDLSPGPDGSLWALYHRSGRKHPVRLAQDRLQTLTTLPQGPPEPTREILRRPLTGAEQYEALRPRNWELGPPFGFIGAGAGGVVGQVVASAADKLRNHAMLLNIAVLGSFDLTDGYLVYLNQERRITWGTGLFQSLVFRQDQTFDDFSFPSGERFYGALGSLRYPLNRFVYMQGDLSVGGVSYFLFPGVERELADGALNPRRENLLPRWYAENAGPRFQTEATVRWGYDTINYAMGTGPIAGSSFLLEGSTAVQPFDDELFGTVRMDAERYFPIFGRTHFFLRAGAGGTFGGRLARQFYLSSFDTLRGIPFGRTDWLIGRHFGFATGELQVPLNAIIRVAIVSDIEAIAGVDFGGVGQTVGEIWDRRVLAPVVGFNFGLGPLILRLHFARPIDTGAPAGLPAANGEWVTNFSIRILGFEGLFSRAPMPETGHAHRRSRGGDALMPRHGQMGFGPAGMGPGTR